jgi:hypothetical protein
MIGLLSPFYVCLKEGEEEEKKKKRRHRFCSLYFIQ